MVINEKHEKFCQAFVLTNNAAASARQAGYSARSSHNQGHRLLQMPHIINRIDNLKKEMETNINVISEIEEQYNFAKTNNHTQSALKALELLTKVKTKTEDESPKTVEELEADIIKSLELLGEDRANRIFLKCSWLKEEDDQTVDGDDGDEVSEEEQKEEPDAGKLEGEPEQVPQSTPQQETN